MQTFRRRLATVALSASLVAGGAVAAPAEVHRVVVRDSEFRVVSEISSEPDMAKFQQHWSSKVTTTLNSVQPYSAFKYKLDISSGTGAGRWLYNPNGLLVKLDKRDRPILQINDPHAFNALLGIRSP